VTPAELARFGDIQPMQVSLKLKTLESKGMVARARSTSDVRAKRIEVTKAGLTARLDSSGLLQNDGNV
jgi:DNA-binding MarR family transcriptional regulator